MAENWRLIPDNRVRHVWKCDCKKAKETNVDPSFYADAGTPVCEECGDGLSYVRTEIKDPIHKALKKAANALRDALSEILEEPGLEIPKKLRKAGIEACAAHERTLKE